MITADKLICILSAFIIFIGTEAVPSGRVSGGEDILEIYDGNWDGSFQKLPEDGQFYPTHICDVSILGDYWVVTLASCVEGLESTMSDYVVCTNTLSYNYECSEHTITRWVIHPDYNPTTGDNNIAVIELDDAIYLAWREAGIVTLPGQNSDPAPGLTMTLYGHGATGEFGNPSTYLKKVDVVISDRTECGEIYPGEVTDNNLCAVSIETGSGACTGDFGASLVSGRILHGMVHRGQKCGDLNYPYIYIRMGMYRVWINEVTGI